MPATPCTPLLALPLKEAHDTELTKPIAQLIQTSYEQRADTYASDLRQIEQARHDAVGQAASDATARDLLFRWFHVLEMLELRFPELRVSFTWSDAFTGTEVTQQALAYEKACVIFAAGARVSRVAAAQPRAVADGDGIKRAYAGMRQAAGLLGYIHDSFLYAPSTDLSSAVVQTLSTLMLLQAAEIFFEKSVHDQKGPALVAKLASHVAATYAALEAAWEEPAADVVPLMWRSVAAYKSKHYASLAQFYRATADSAAHAHGMALGRLRYAHDLATEAVRCANSIDVWSAASQMRATVPPELCAAAHSMTQAHADAVAARLATAERDNDLVYLERATPESALPPIDQTSVAHPIPIRETFAQPDVQRVLGADLLQSLIPLSVHESASLYSEEKAKMVRAESAAVASADAEVAAAIDSLCLPGVLDRFASIDGRGAARAAPCAEVRECAAVPPDAGAMDAALERLPRRAARASEALDAALADLDADARECERARVVHGAEWTQPPTASAARALRRDVQDAREALAVARESDARACALWRDVRADLALLERGEGAVCAAYERENAPPASLVDVDDTPDAVPAARALLQQARDTLAALRRMPAERAALLNQLKQRIMSDDISRTLLLNRRVQNVEPRLFAAELGKFAPLRAQLREQVATQAARIDSLREMLAQLQAHPGTAEARRAWDAAAETQQRLDAQLLHAIEARAKVRAILGRADAFYADMALRAEQLALAAERFVAERRAERAAASSASAPRPPGADAAAPRTTLAEDLAALQLGYGGRGSAGAPPAPYAVQSRATDERPPRPPRPYV